VGEFGDKFRKTREKKEFSLDDVSHVTKIGVRMLRAIEEERFEQLPGGIFNKGFIRSYAKHLGLNDDDAITDYLACLRQAQIDAGEFSEPQSASVKARGKPGKIEVKKSEARKSEINSSAAKSESADPVEELPELQLPRAADVRPRQTNFSEDSARGIPWGMVGIAAVVLILALLFWMRRSHGPSTAAASTSPSTSASKPPSTSSSASARLESAKLEPIKTESAAPAAIITPPARVVTAIPKPTIQASSPSSTLPAPAPVSTPSSQAKATAPLTLVIRATETSWISVLADGQPVSHETLIAPAHTSVRASREIVARIGNSAGVTFVWNGQEVPADGAESEVKTFVFDSAGMRVVPSTPAPAQNR
jgi:cytoskeleton protein RodZ